MVLEPYGISFTNRACKVSYVSAASLDEVYRRSGSATYQAAFNLKADSEWKPGKIMSTNPLQMCTGRWEKSAMTKLPDSFLDAREMDMPSRLSETRTNKVRILDSHQLPADRIQ
jgi:hypothetical protein